MLRHTRKGPCRWARKRLLSRLTHGLQQRSLTDDATANRKSAGVLSTASKNQIRVSPPGSPGSNRVLLNNKYHKNSDTTPAAQVPPVQSYSSVNVFLYRNTWISFFDLVMHASQDPNWTAKGVSTNFQPPSWRSLPLAERRKLLEARRLGLSGPAYDSSLRRQTPTPTGVLNNESDDGAGVEEGSIAGNSTPHSDLAPAMSPQMRCQQIVHNHCLSSHDIEVVLDALNDGVLPGMASDSNMYTELVMRLLIEGRYDRAAQVVGEDIPRAGLQASTRAKESLQTPGHVLNRRRTRWFGQLESFGMDGIRSADRLFNSLLLNNAIDPIICAA